MDYEEVASYVMKTQGVTVVEVARMLEANGVGSKGELVLYWPYEPGVLWAGASGDLQDVLQQLINDDRMEVYPTQQLTYMVDGEGLNMPLATVASVECRHPYKNDRWLPLVFNKA